MKENYEKTTQFFLYRRMPVIIRVDGRAFHTFTKHFDRPFDEKLMKAMDDTMLQLCKRIQNCVFAYKQSDEISLLLTDYETFESQPWFDNKVQKISSITASMATFYFNKAFAEVLSFFENFEDRYVNAVETGAFFDSRCFNIPKEEVTNYFYWRQIDASRNSVQMVAQNYYSQKALQNKNTDDMQDMLFREHGINWNDFDTPKKRGTACYRVDHEWYIDYNIPIFKGEDRDLIEKLI